MPTPRNHATAGVVNGKVYVIGGRVGSAFISGCFLWTSASQGDEMRLQQSNQIADGAGVMIAPGIFDTPMLAAMAARPPCRPPP